MFSCDLLEYCGSTTRHLLNNHHLVEVFEFVEVQAASTYRIISFVELCPSKANNCSKLTTPADPVVLGKSHEVITREYLHLKASLLQLDLN